MLLQTTERLLAAMKYEAKKKAASSRASLQPTEPNPEASRSPGDAPGWGAVGWKDSQDPQRTADPLDAAFESQQDPADPLDAAFESQQASPGLSQRRPSSVHEMSDETKDIIKASIMSKRLDGKVSEDTLEMLAEATSPHMSAAPSPNNATMSPVHTQR
jgi:hypothetical protein